MVLCLLKMQPHKIRVQLHRLINCQFNRKPRYKITRENIDKASRQELQYKMLKKEMQQALGALRL